MITDSISYPLDKDLKSFVSTCRFRKRAGQGSNPSE